MSNLNIRQSAMALRKKGYSFTEIQKHIGQRISKSTLSHWLRDIALSPIAKSKIRNAQSQGLKKARDVAVAVRKSNRTKQAERITKHYAKLPHLLLQKDVATIALSMLYLGEGGKHRKGALVFGNASPQVIKIFLLLLRTCFVIDESKFRCTVQGRADQNFSVLKTFWSKATGIPTRQFYNPQIDKRTLGRPTRKIDYKGVCRIDYFSSEVFTTIVKVMEMLIEGR